MLPSHTAIIIHLHKMLQLQHKLQQQVFGLKFWTSPTNFPLCRRIAIRSYFFHHKIKEQTSLYKFMAFYIHFENSITTKFSYEKMGQSGTLTIFLKMGPLGAPKTFLFIHDFASTTKCNHSVNILFQRVFFIVRILKYAYACSTTPHPIHYKTELFVLLQ